MIVLVLNCGSSSLKYQVLDMKSESENSLLAKGVVERIGEPVGNITHKVSGKDKYTIEKPVPDHTAGIKNVLDLLTDRHLGALNSLDDIDAVGHRVAHGGEYFDRSVLVTPEVVEKIKECCDLAPLHNPANLLGIEAVEKLMFGTPQVAVFDTSFHQTMPDYAYTYSIPYKYYDKYRIRRYGFHGTSHKFVAKKACDFVGMDLNNSKIVTCHLGNGSSVTAVCNGKSVDTSMGFTPVEGVTMGTRCGNIDAGALLYLQEKEGLDAAAVNKIINKQSGLLGITGASPDCRDMVTSASSGNPKAILAMKVLCYGIKKYIGAYAAAMNGLDLVVMTGGIGENNQPVREGVLSDMEWLGIEFDKEVNAANRGNDVVLSKPGSKVKVVVVTTDEELVIARDTMNLVNKK